jgi:tight adherence protein C
MLLLTISAAALSAALAVFLVADMALGRPAQLNRRLAEIQVLGADPSSLGERRRRQRRSARVQRLIARLGRLRASDSSAEGRLTTRLVQAGFDSPNAITLYLGTQVAAAALLALVAGVIGGARQAPTALTVGLMLYAAAVGWLLPWLWVQMRLHRRQREIRRVLPDAIDLLVVCVEAGLGLNQALVRLSRDISEASRELARELAMTNLQIRAGTPREAALRGLAERTGIADVRALVTTLVQTDRFGTSVARSLRIHARSLRNERRQASEEAAAKTAIKMVFPLVFCVFPALFVVILGPGLLEMISAWMRGF